MISAIALIAGGGLRAIGEVAEIIAGGPSPTSAVLAATALVLIAAGFLGLWPDARSSRTGQVAIGLTALGALCFTALALYSLTLGVLPLEEITRTPAFIVSVLITLIGTLALAAWLIKTPLYPRWIGIVMCLSILTSLIISFVPASPVIQPIIDIVMAATFIQLGLSMAERARKEKKH